MKPWWQLQAGESLAWFFLALPLWFQGFSDYHIEKPPCLSPLPLSTAHHREPPWARRMGFRKPAHSLGGRPLPVLDLILPVALTSGLAACGERKTAWSIWSACGSLMIDIWANTTWTWTQVECSGKTVYSVRILNIPEQTVMEKDYFCVDNLPLTSTVVHYVHLPTN